jgi:putative glutamine amidotransferase
MKILMSQRDVRIPPNNFLFDCLERSWYELLYKHTLIPVANIGVIDESIDFDCLILTGGPDSIARHVTEDKLFYHALKLNKPIIGVCHGAFTVNDLTGGKNGRIEDHTDTSHLVNMDGGTHTVNSFHSQFLETLGPDMVVTATDLDGNAEAFEHATTPLYGIVWHPERMKFPILPKKVKELLEVD